jgi:hypothetical protein
MHVIIHYISNMKVSIDSLVSVRVITTTTTSRNPMTVSDDEISIRLRNYIGTVLGATKVSSKGGMPCM